MNTYIRLNGETVSAIVTSKIKPDGYIEVPSKNLPNDLFLDLGAYTYDGDSFSKRVLGKEEERHKLSAELRVHRDRKLSACDWTQVADTPVDHHAWAEYRQALRDITQQVEFPYEVVWPDVPK